MKRKCGGGARPFCRDCPNTMQAEFCGQFRCSTPPPATICVTPGVNNRTGIYSHCTQFIEGNEAPYYYQLIGSIAADYGVPYADYNPYGLGTCSYGSAVNAGGVHVDLSEQWFQQDYLFEFFNPRFLNMFGADPQQFVGATLSDNQIKPGLQNGIFATL